MRQVASHDAMTRRTGSCLLLLLTIDMCNGQGCVPSNCLSMNCAPGNTPSDAYNLLGDSDPTFNDMCRQLASSMQASNECANCPACLEALDNLQLVIADAVTSCSTYATYGTAACDALDVCLQGGDGTGTPPPAPTPPPPSPAAEPLVLGDVGPHEHTRRLSEACCDTVAVTLTGAALSSRSSSAGAYTVVAGQTQDGRAVYRQRDL